MTSSTATNEKNAADVLERVSDAFFALDEKWRFTYVNGAAEDLVGRGEDELLGRRLWDAFPEAASSTFESEYRRAMETREPVTFEARYEPLDATFEVRAFPSESGLSVYFCDVTEKRRLERRRLGYEAVLDGMADAVWVVDSDRSILFVNRIITTVLGDAREDIVGEDYRERLAQIFPDPEAAEAYREIVEAVLAGERDEGALEFPVEFDGDRVDLDIQVGALDFGADRHGAVVVGRDVTERRGHERELQQARDEYAELINGMNDTAWVIGRDERFLAVNDAAVDTLGYSREELLSMTPIDIDAGLDDAEISSLIADMPEDEVQVFETVHRAKDGTEIPVEISSSLVSYRGETAILSIARDVTERQERTQQLERANTQLKLLNRIVRHDIRNDMNVALGWSGELEPHVDAEGEPILDRIESSHKHVIDLTKVVRDLVNLLSEDGEVELEPTDLGDHLARGVETRRTLYPDAVFELPEEHPDATVSANELLSSVFRNLLNNAVQHNDKDEPRVEVTVEADPDSVTVRIADNGPGIPADRRDAVFGRGESGLDDPSAGIGLYLVETLVRSYGGEVWVEANEPVGSVFVVTLPLAGGGA